MVCLTAKQQTASRQSEFGGSEYFFVHAGALARGMLLVNQLAAVAAALALPRCASTRPDILPLACPGHAAASQEQQATESRVTLCRLSSHGMAPGDPIPAGQQTMATHATADAALTSPKLPTASQVG